MLNNIEQQINIFSAACVAGEVIDLWVLGAELYQIGDDIPYIIYINL